MATQRIPYSGKGTIAKKIKGPKELYDFLWSLTEHIKFHKDSVVNEEMRQKAHHFIAHVYNSINKKLVKKDNAKKIDIDHQYDCFIPINGKLIDKVFGRDFKVLDLRDKGLIQIIGANNLKHLSRYYSLPRLIWETASKIENRTTSEAWLALTEGIRWKYTPVDIITGARIRTVYKNVFEPSGQRFKTPGLIKDAIKAISPCVINPKYVGWWVDYLEHAFEKRKAEIYDRIAIGDPDRDEIDDLNTELFRLEKKYINERSSQRTILYQQPKLLKRRSETGELLYEYRAAYKPQVSGRLTEIGGGLQNASRVFKSLAFKGVPGFFNYDLKASQANILMKEFEDCGIDKSWITDYMSDPKAKTTYSERVGVDEETWKTCLYAVFMGANPNMLDSTIQNALLDASGDSVDKAKLLLIKFKMVTKNLLLTANAWRAKIISPTESPYIYSSRKGGYRYWENACGMRHKTYGVDRNNRIVLMADVADHAKSPDKYPIVEIKSKAETKRKLAAFILQGKEACFIHHLTLLCKLNGIVVMKNEHDGIITDKEIPPELITEAGVKAKLPAATLVPKDLASEHDITTASVLIGKLIK